MINLPKLKLFLIFIFFFLNSAVIQAADIKFTPQSPLVEIGKSIVLSVSGTEGEITWQSPLKGQIQLQGVGQQVTYFAPMEAGVDEVKVADSAGNMGTVRILIPPAGTNPLSLENAVWKVFTSRSSNNAIVLSEDEKTLWVGTNGGLEQRNAITGSLIRIFTELDGLPSNMIRHLQLDGAGGLWVGTIVEHQGVLVHLLLNSQNQWIVPTEDQWTVYKEENSGLTDSQVNTLIRTIYIDTVGELWVGFGDGDIGLVHRRVDDSWEVFNKDNSGLPSNQIYALCTDGSGGLWIGTSEGLVHRQVDGFWETITLENHLVDKSIIALYPDGVGGLWIGQRGFELWYRRADGFLENLSQEISDLASGIGVGGEINVISSDSVGDLWIGTAGGLGLIHRRADGSWEAFSPRNFGLPYKSCSSCSVIWSLQSDDIGNMWVGSTDGLARRHANGTWEVFNSWDSGLPTNHILALSADGTGGLWIGANKINGLIKGTPTEIPISARGSDEKGLAHRRSDGTWEIYVRYNSNLPNSEIIALQTDSSGDLWIGTYGSGLVHRSDSGEWTIYNQYNSKFLSNHVYSLLSDDQGGLWIGTGDAGLVYRSSNDERTVYNTENSGLPGNRILSLINDDQGGLWIGTGGYYDGDTDKIIGGGLAHRNADGSWETFTPDNSELPSNSVMALYTDSEGDLWIGTDNGVALAYRDNGRWHVLYAENDINVVAFSSDSRGGFWMATYDGLVKYSVENDEWQVFDTTNSGLPSNKIYSLLNDDQGGLWVGTDKGLARFFLPLSLTQKLIQPTVTTDLDTAQHLVTDRRAAILITGGTNSSANGLWPTAESISTYFYSVLYKRGFQKDDIYFLSPQSWADFNGDGRDDKIVAAPKPERPVKADDIKDALDWAKKHGDPETGKLDQPLFLFFIGHGHSSGEKILLEESDIDEELFATQLKEMLDKYQAETGNAVVVIIEACYSGKFRDTLANTSFPRTVISSTDDTAAKFDDYDHRGFSRFFASSLLTGHSLSQAFAEASTQQQALVTTMKDRFGQVPKWTESQTAPEVFVNGPFKAGETLQITSLLKTDCSTENSLAAICLDKNEFPFLLQAQIEQHDRPVERVWAVLKPPNVQPVLDTNGNAFLPYPRLAMSPSAEDNNVWEVHWNGAIYKGDYELTFYAEDDERNLAGSSPVTLNIEEGSVPEGPPEKPQVKITLRQQNDKGNWREVFEENPRYHRGQLFQAKLQEDLSWGYDLYVAITFPNQKDYLAFKNFNVPFDLNIPKKWRGVRKQGEPVTILELPIPEELEVGQYCFYGILSPEQNDIFEAKDQGLWIFGQQCFEVF